MTAESGKRKAESGESAVNSLARAMELVARWMPSVRVKLRDPVTVEIGDYLLAPHEEGWWSVSELGSGSGMPLRIVEFASPESAVLFAAGVALNDRLNDERDHQRALEGAKSTAPGRPTLTLRRLDEATMIVDAVPVGMEDCPPEFRDVARVIDFRSYNPGLVIPRPLGCDAVGRILQLVDLCREAERIERE